MKEREDAAAREDATAQILAMRQQERKNYTCKDYLYQDQPEGDSTSSSSLMTTNMRTRMMGQQSQSAVSVGSRQMMVEWCYRVIDFCSFERETVEYALSYMDRFLLTREGSESLRDRRLFQLLTMTALYTAVKLNEPEVMTPELMEELSQGEFSAQDIETMELSLLHGINWYLNPPTTLSYVRTILELMVCSNKMDSRSTRRKVYDLAKSQIEWAVGDYEMVPMPRFVLAVAALSNAIEATKPKTSPDLHDLLKATFAGCGSIEEDLEQSQSVRSCLDEVISQKSSEEPCMGIVKSVSDVTSSSSSKVSSVGTAVCAEDEDSPSVKTSLSPRTVSMVEQGVA